MAGRFVSVPMTLSDLEKPDMKINFFQVDLNNAGYIVGQPRDCICTNASCGLSTTAEFLVGPRCNLNCQLVRYE